jgi:hypothetical protein
MSYLGYPRLHFSGRFLADPSTVNNTPNNYDPANSQTSQLELYWNPNGTGIFDLMSCVVTKVVYGPGDEASTPAQDPIVGQTVAAVYTNAPAKLVDLDPCQQNVSELWGLTLQIAGPGANPRSIPNFVRGDFVANSFNAIWGQATEGPRSSASGAGVYQSQLKNLAWDTASKPGSRFITILNRESPDRLSINFVVNAHNNAPVQYGFNTDSFTRMKNPPYNIPESILNKLLPLQKYIQNVGRTAGNVPTESYVNFEVTRLLGQADAQTYISSILKATLVPYNPGNIETTFPTGYITGTLGPQPTAAPVFYTPSRTMAPVGKSICYFAPFNAVSVNGKSIITLNLGNSLATNKPGYDFATNKLGALKLVYFNQRRSQEISLNNAVTLAEIPGNYPGGLPALMKNNAGILDVAINPALLPKDITPAQANADVLNMPLGLVGATGGQPVIWLAENILGYNVRADQFVFRMNPGIKTTEQQPMGETTQVSFYITRFGQPAGRIALKAWKLNEKDAIAYTEGTLGTGGTRGIKNLSIPQNALKLANSDGPTTIIADVNGVARLSLQAGNPGSPRASQDLDGQVYFIKYNFNDEGIAKTFTQDANDLLSVQVYTQPNIPAKPTWDNCIKNILPLYAKLYPIMGRFRLNDYQYVYENRIAIKTVLSKPMEDPLRMPVIRDLSILRTNAVIDWINNGAVKS